jgi:hypothetical protein
MFPIFDTFFQGRHRIIPLGRRLLESSPHTLPSQQSTAGPCTSTEQSPLQKKYAPDHQPSAPVRPSHDPLEHEVVLGCIPDQERTLSGDGSDYKARRMVWQRCRSSLLNTGIATACVAARHPFATSIPRATWQPVQISIWEPTP